jgi:hypothetical protein
MSVARQMLLQVSVRDIGQLTDFEAGSTTPREQDVTQRRTARPMQAASLWPLVSNIGHLTDV